MRQYGWRRIPSLPNWQRDFYALEYWHYQKEDGLTWWAAIHEIYTPPEIERLFTYEKLLRARYNVLTMIEKGVPVPSEALQRYQALEP
jgi:TolB protein